MKFVRYKTSHGAVVAIMGAPRRKFTPLVYLDFPVRLHKVPNAVAEKHTQELTTVPVHAAARRMLEAGQRMGMTLGAERLLKDAEEVIA